MRSFLDNYVFLKFPSQEIKEKYFKARMNDAWKYAIMISISPVSDLILYSITLPIFTTRIVSKYMVMLFIIYVFAFFSRKSKVCLYLLPCVLASLIYVDYAE